MNKARLMKRLEFPRDQEQQKRTTEREKSGRC